MAKTKENSTKSAAAQAAAQSAPETKTNGQNNSSKSTNVQVIQLGDLDKLAQQRSLAGLDPNHAEDLLARIDDRFYKDPNAATRYNISQETVDKINEITARGFIALLANEVEIAQNSFAVRMRMSTLEALKEAAVDMRINIDTKALPAPDSEGFVQVPSTAIKPSADAKKGLKAEREAAAEKVQLDPSKIETEEALKKSLLSILVKGNGSENLYDKISTAINFYESYLAIQAGKTENPETAREELKKKSRTELFSDIAHLLGKCTFTIGGIAKFMYEQTERTKNPVVAFCTLRDASLNTKTGMPQVDDSLVADIVKVLIRWYADTDIAVTNEVIAGFERNLEILKKDSKKNAKGIEDGKKKIENAKNHIKNVEDVVLYVNVPDRSVIDNFASDYTDNNREGYKMARMMGSKIVNTYYPGLDVKSVNKEALVHNLQQYVGVIANMFLPPLSQLADFSEANITELEKIKTNNEKPKNE